MVKVKSNREEVIARAKADVEARKKLKKSRLKKAAEKSVGETGSRSEPKEEVKTVKG